MEARLLEAFPRARPDTRAALADAVRVSRNDAGTSIYVQGGDVRLSLLLSGLAALRRTTPGGRQFMPLLVGAGEVVGLLGLVSRPAAFDLVAIAGAEVASWGSRIVLETAADPGLALDLFDHATSLVARLAERFDVLLPQGALPRVARILSLYEDAFFGDPALLKRSHLPLFVGTSPEMSRRVLRRLETLGIVGRAGARELRLLDARALRLVANQPVEADRRDR